MIAILALAACSGHAPGATETTAVAPAAVPASTSVAAGDEATSEPTARPDPRMGHAIVAIGDGELLVFGGRSSRGLSEVFLDDTWIYDATDNTWSELVAPGPLARSQHAMAYDSKRGEVLVFGGYVGSSFTYSDTWLFNVDRQTWRRIRPEVAPTGRAGSVLTYDESSDLYVMFAGAEEPPAPELPLAETWVFDPETRNWSDVTNSGAPVLVSEGHPTLFELALVYDSLAARSVLLVAGEATWVFDAGARQWARSDPQTTQGLGADYMVAAAFDAELGRTVAYGGAPVSRTQHTWLFDSDDGVWEEVATTSVPGPIANHAMAFDPMTGATYLFGGATAVLVLEGTAPVTDEMWVFDEAGWRLAG